MKKLNKKGFTIVELVIVIAVIAILAAVLIPTFATVIDKANKSAAVSAAKNAYTAYLAEDKANIIAGKDLKIFTGKYEVSVTDNKLVDNALNGSNEKVTYTAASGTFAAGTYYLLSNSNYITAELTAEPTGWSTNYYTSTNVQTISGYTFEGTFEGCDVYAKAPTP